MFGEPPSVNKVVPRKFQVSKLSPEIICVQVMGPKGHMITMGYACECGWKVNADGFDVGRVVAAHEIKHLEEVISDLFKLNEDLSLKLEEDPLDLAVLLAGY